jgi:hypothetical protein
MGETPETTAEDDVRSQVMVSATTRSAETGRKVTVA